MCRYDNARFCSHMTLRFNQWRLLTLGPYAYIIRNYNVENLEKKNVPTETFRTRL